MRNLLNKLVIWSLGYTPKKESEYWTFLVDVGKAEEQLMQISHKCEIPPDFLTVPVVTAARYIVPDEFPEIQQFVVVRLRNILWEEKVGVYMHPKIKSGNREILGER